ncbi:MAG: 3'-5' exonuclease [Bacteroidota bacterium]
MYLFFDVDAIGLPKKWSRPVSDTFNWPRMVQIAWQTYDEQQTLIESHRYIIKPEGYDIPYESERIHKISTEKAQTEGIALKEVLEKFSLAIRAAQYVAAHNMNFDEKVVGAEFIRKNISHQLFSSERYCTMQEGTWFCKIPSKQGRYKWPSLTELHFKLFGTRLENTSDPSLAVAACAACFFKLVELEDIL